MTWFSVTSCYIWQVIILKILYVGAGEKTKMGETIKKNRVYITWFNAVVFIAESAVSLAG